MEEKGSAEAKVDEKTAVEKDRMNKFAATLFKITAVYLCFIIILSVLFQKVLLLSLISGSSMADTLLPEDLVISTRYDTGVEDINRYDILIFTLPDDPEQEYVKRVIGLPGETIEIRTNGKVYADGVELDDSFIKEMMEWYDNDTWIVPEGSYFVMGDNRNNSIDSRHWEECVPVENVLAKEKFIVIRLSRFGYKGEES